MRTLLDDSTMFQHENFVGILHGDEPMGNQKEIAVNATLKTFLLLFINIFQVPMSM